MRITPLYSIRKYCLWCCNNSFQEIQLCPSIKCPLYKFRFGKGKGRKLRAIRLKCLDCSAGNSEEVKKCEFRDCPLFSYRSGRGSGKPRGKPFLKKITLKSTPP